MSEQDPILRALGEVAREQERDEVEQTPLRAEQIDRFTRAALDARGPKVVAIGRRRVLLALGAAAAVAASVVLYTRVSTSPPRYAMSVEGADQPTRGDDAGIATTTFSKGALIRVVLKPVGSAGGSDAAAYLMRGDEVRGLAVNLVRAENGAMRFEGVREQLLGDASGSWELVVFVGPAARIPRDAAEARKGRAASDHALQVLTAPIFLP